MPNFQLNHVPYTLKSRILANLRIADSLELLKTNVELRHQVLRNGPFQKVTKVHVTAYNTQIDAENELLGEDLWIEIDRKDEHFSFCLDDSDEQWTPAEDSNFWRIPRLFDELVNIRELILSIHGPIESENSRRVKLERHLQKFRFTAKAMLSSERAPILSALLANFRAKVVEQLDLCLLIAGESPASVDGGEIWRLLTNNLTDCGEINLFNMTAFGGDPRLYAALQKTNFTQLTLIFDCLDDFWATIERFLRTETPNRNPQARIDICCLAVEANMEDYEFSPGVDEFLQRFTESLDYSRREECAFAKLRTKFCDNLVINYFEDGHRGPFEITRFRRVISENSQILYVFVRYTDSMRFYSVVENLSDHVATRKVELVPDSDHLKHKTAQRWQGFQK